MHPQLILPDKRRHIGVFADQHEAFGSRWRPCNLKGRRDVPSLASILARNLSPIGKSRAYQLHDHLDVQTATVTQQKFFYVM